MPRFLSTLFELRESGFEIIRYESRGFLSIMRKGEYIDIYFFSEYEHNSRLIICCMDICPQKFLTETTIINFLGAEFKVPKDYEKYLEFNYGKNWKEPMAKFNFGLTGSSKLKSKIIQYIKAVIPEKIAEYIQSKKEKNYQQNCLVKVEKFL